MSIDPFAAELEAQAQHLVKMARNPLWKAYAAGRARELAAHPSGIFKDLPARIAELVTQEKIDAEVRK